MDEIANGLSMGHDKDDDVCSATTPQAVQTLRMEKKNSFCNVFLYEMRIRKQQVTKIRRRRLNRRINWRRIPSCLRPGLSYA